MWVESLVDCCWCGEDAAEGFVLLVLSVDEASGEFVCVESRWCGLDAELGDVVLV
jgi:hypothetical protein